MGKFKGLKLIISLSAWVVALQSCNETSETVPVPGFASGTSGSFPVGVGATGGIATGGTSGTNTDDIELEVLPLTGLELPQGGAAGSPAVNTGGAAGADLAGSAGAQEAGAAGAPPDPPALDGEILAGIWDDNLNYEHFQSAQNHPGSVGAFKLTPVEYQSAHEASAKPGEARQTVDIALIVDTTGSMQDELAYLASRMGEVWESVVDQHPQADPNFALVVYRDEGDDYVSHSFDFTAAQTDFEQLLDEQEAAGGGDVPEAAEVALAEMNELSWRSAETTRRLAFWFTDAPHRIENEASLRETVLAAKLNDIVIYPVASSNVNVLASFTLRNVAQYTGGSYVFLTKASQTYQLPHLLLPPCSYITTLSAVLARIVDIELSGTYHPPKASTLITTHSRMVSGTCNTEYGSGFAF